MPDLITVHPFLEITLNLKVQKTGNDIFHMESHFLLLANFYPVRNIWIVRTELKGNIFQVSTIFLISAHLQKAADLALRPKVMALYKNANLLLRESEVRLIS